MKEHGRLARWQVQRFALSPEEAGLTGCAQFILVRRERQKLRRGQVVEHSIEYAYYVTSLTEAEASARELGEAIRGHWNACENGAHYRRDVSLGEDASQISGRAGAQAMATLRNLTLGLFELQKQRGQTTAAYLPGWGRKMTMSRALQLIKGG